MAGWVGHMAALLEPLAERVARHVRAGAALHADDTPVPVLDPGRGQTKTGRLWTAVRDESLWIYGAAGGLLSLLSRLRIPTQSGQGFRFDVGHRSDLIPATIPK